MAAIQLWAWLRDLSTSNGPVMGLVTPWRMSQGSRPREGSGTSYIISSSSTFMRGSRKFLSEGVQRWPDFFLVWWGKWSKYNYEWAINGPPAKRHLNGVSLAGRWRPNIECCIGSLVILRRSGPVLLRNPIFFVFFQGGPDPLFPPLDPHMTFSPPPLTYPYSHTPSSLFSCAIAF